MLTKITEQSSRIFFWSRLPQDLESVSAGRTSIRCNPVCRSSEHACAVEPCGSGLDQPAVCAAGMTDLSSRAFAFSEKCGLLTSLNWGSAIRTVWSGLSQLPSTKLSWRSAAFLLTCPRDHVTRIALLPANWSLLAIPMPLQIDGEATLCLPSCIF